MPLLYQNLGILKTGFCEFAPEFVLALIAVWNGVLIFLAGVDAKNSVAPVEIGWLQLLSAIPANNCLVLFVLHGCSLLDDSTV